MAAYDYEHTQRGTLMRISLGCAALAGFYGGMVLRGSGDAGTQIAATSFTWMAFGMLVLLALFHSLTVRVSREEVLLYFGVGLIRKRFDCADIQDPQVVRTKWINGWGIHMIRGGGWLYNVSGFGAVEFQHRNGKCYRIGTDEPEALLAAIEAAIPQRAEQ